MEDEGGWAGQERQFKCGDDSARELSRLRSNETPRELGRNGVSWRDFWNGKTTIYANQRHKDVHYRLIAEEIVGLIGAPDERVLDFGCGEAHSAELVADACGELILCDAAESVRARVAERTAGLRNVAVMGPETVEQLPAGGVDVIVVNSVIQYLSRPELERWLAIWRRLLSAHGRLVIGDIVPRSVGPAADALALLKFARANGFLVAASIGLVRTALSDYRRKRAELGLLQLEEGEISDIARQSGFLVARSRQNLGHNPMRLTVVATPALVPVTLVPGLESYEHRPRERMRAATA